MLQNLTYYTVIILYAKKFLHAKQLLRKAKSCASLMNNGKEKKEKE